MVESKHCLATNGPHVSCSEFLRAIFNHDIKKDLSMNRRGPGTFFCFGMVFFFAFSSNTKRELGVDGEESTPVSEKSLRITSYGRKCPESKSVRARVYITHWRHFFSMLRLLFFPTTFSS